MRNSNVSQLDASNESVTVGADTSIVTKPDVSFEIMAVADASIEPQPDASNETVAVGADTSIVAKPDVSSETTGTQEVLRWGRPQPSRVSSCLLGSSTRVLSLECLNEGVLYFTC